MSSAEEVEGQPRALKIETLYVKVQQSVATFTRLSAMPTLTTKGMVINCTHHRAQIKNKKKSIVKHF